MPPLRQDPRGVVSVSVVEVILQQPLWSQWAIAAVEQRDVAALARADLERQLNAADWYIPAQRELRAGMQSISAAAFAIEGWAFAADGEVAQQTLGSSGVMRIIRARHRLPEDLRKKLTPRLDVLYRHRGELVHHKSPARSGKRHPLYGSTAHESATYSYEGAVEACETLRMIVQFCHQYPNPDRPPDPAAEGHANIVIAEVGW